MRFTTMMLRPKLLSELLCIACTVLLLAGNFFFVAAVVELDFPAASVGAAPQGPSLPDATRGGVGRLHAVVQR